MRFLESATRRRVSRRKTWVESGPRTKFVVSCSAAIGSPMTRKALPMLVIIDSKIAVDLKDVVMVSEDHDVTLGSGDRPLRTHVHLAGGHKFVLEGDVGRQFSRLFADSHDAVVNIYSARGTPERTSTNTALEDK